MTKSDIVKQIFSDAKVVNREKNTQTLVADMAKYTNFNAGDEAFNKQFMVDTADGMQVRDGIFQMTGYAE